MDKNVRTVALLFEILGIAGMSLGLVYCYRTFVLYQARNLGWDFPGLPIMAGVLVVFGGLFLLCGIGLLRHRNAARNGSMALCLLSLAFGGVVLFVVEARWAVPIGTALVALPLYGIWTLTRSWKLG
jgi:hypothetical protein